MRQIVHPHCYVGVKCCTRKGRISEPAPYEQARSNGFSSHSKTGSLRRELNVRENPFVASPASYWSCVVQLLPIECSGFICPHECPPIFAKYCREAQLFSGDGHFSHRFPQILSRAEAREVEDRSLAQRNERSLTSPVTLVHMRANSPTVRKFLNPALKWSFFGASPISVTSTARSRESICKSLPSSSCRLAGETSPDPSDSKSC